MSTRTDKVFKAKGDPVHTNTLEMVVPKPLTAQNKSSFAYITAKDRLPDILCKIIDGLHRYGVKDESTKEDVPWEAVKTVIGNLSRMRYEIMTDKPLVSLDPALTEEDNDIWERVLREYTEENGKPPSWFSAPWLYWESYMYRSIQMIVTSCGVPNLDVFQKSKQDQLLASQTATNTLSRHLEETLTNEALNSDKKEYYCRQMFQIALWGNLCDLSISGLSANAQEHDPLEELERLAPFVVSDATDAIWAHLSSSAPTHIGVVLDNAGFELVCDLSLVDVLIRAKVASKVTLHAKAMPWYVSDVTPSDFEWTLGQLGPLGNRVNEYMADGRLELKHHRFWTTSLDYPSMPKYCPDLYEELSHTGLLLFKGDLNYRKLVADREWDPTTPFRTALCGFHPAPLCAFRVCKADVVTGLDHAAVERMKQDEWPNVLWKGKYAVIQADL